MGFKGVIVYLRKEGSPIDLHMVEIMEMQHRSESDTQVNNTVAFYRMHSQWYYERSALQ
jgi:GTP cyclohydrolase II